MTTVIDLRRNGVKKFHTSQNAWIIYRRGLFKYSYFPNDKNVVKKLATLLRKRCRIRIYETVLIEEAGDANENYLPCFKKF
ncbi:unnamed protein product [Rhizophagus irregularis]|nr:unnamed protein product [Rhizophagus irregularis]